MGRPIKKKFFGTPNKDGKQLVLASVWLEGSTEAETGYYVVKQKGSDRYLVTNGVKKGVIRLVDVLPDAPGEGVIEISIPGVAQREYAKKIYGRTLHTFDDNRYLWSTKASDNAQTADLPFEEYVTAVDAADYVGDINTAASATALLAVLTSNMDVFFSSDIATKFAQIATNGGGRQAAVGDGVYQNKVIFGNYVSLAKIQDAVEFHVKTEFTKSVMIRELDAAKNAKALVEAILATFPACVDERDALIDELSKSADNDAVALSITLRNDEYTTVFAKLLEVLKAGEKNSVIGASMYANRQAISPSKKFNGVARILTAAKAALAL